MILFSRTVTDKLISFQTESSTAADMFESLTGNVFGKKITVGRRENVRRNKSLLNTLEISGSENVEAVLKKYRIDPCRRKIDSEIIVNNSLGVFTAGIFMACGSVNDPSKEYHLEFAVPCEQLAEDLTDLLSEIGVYAKTALRRGQHIVYIKGSESIEDTLTFIGAQQCTLELMNVKIYKDVRNKANRIANCDTANIDKVLNAAMRQIEDIKLIDRTIGLDTLSDELREAAQIRLENAEMSLQEIGDSLSVPISRSGVNHRFKKLAAIAAEIRLRGESNES